MYSLGTERCPAGVFSSEQVILLPGMTTLFQRPDSPKRSGNVDPYDNLSGLLPASVDKNVYLLPHTSMKFSTGMSRLFVHHL